MSYNEIKTNFHTHTLFCGHADGLPIDYLDKIDELHIKTLGFSEHAYVGVPSFKHTIKTPEDMNKYYDEVIKLRNATDTEVLVGLEVDYFPRLNSYYKELKEKYDYLSLSVHFVEYNGALTYGTRFNYLDEMRLYCSYMNEALKTGLFAFINHPDLFLNDFMNEYHDSIEIKGFEEAIIKQAISFNKPLELNVAQFIRYRHLYEKDNIRDDFWQMAGKMQAKVIVNFDAHSKDLLSLENYNMIMDYADGHNLNIIDDFRKCNYDERN